MKKNKTTLFTLTRQNQKGQVAIFVALIFQVIFIFFALLINVGLLIHHKINLQHSTDLAAYYGAMKQAEQMNALAHINFQMRQAWKLLTWRYRVLGTFGFIPNTANSGASQIYPFGVTSNSGGAPGQFLFNGTRGVFPTASSPFTNGPASGPDARNCNRPTFTSFNSSYLVDGTAIGIQDVPFFCVGHSGFNSWPQAESNCQLDCSMFSEARVIAALPTVPNVTTPFGGNVAGSVNATINQVNQQIQQRCQRLGPTGAALLSKFLIAYATEAILRGETIKMLAGNLSQTTDRMVDIDGKLISEGSERTFKNNLTGANFTGLSSDSFETYNGLSGGSCRFRQGSSDDNNPEFLKKIDFKLINYFIHFCEGNDSASLYKPQGMYAGNGLSQAFGSLNPEVRDFLLSFFDPNSRHTIGYEKNPHCVQYFAVKTSSEPTIPFLPLSKIKLTATAAAKPFGGSMGPWYGTQWQLGSPKSSYVDSDPNTKTDATLPMRDFTGDGASGFPDLKKSVYTQPNFSLFVGDKLGVRNLDYLASYHSMLIRRDIAAYPGTSYAGNRNLTQGELRNAGPWPNYDNWSNVDVQPPDFRNYDSLAKPDPNVAGTRALEITAIVPNQFDVTYYSIDPDFYNNYYIRIYNAFDEIKGAAGNGVNLTANQLRPDFGANRVTGTQSSTSLDEKSFSVKDQILLKNIVLNTSPLTQPSYRPQGSNGNTYDRFLNYLVSFQASLLTGWTFLRFNDYDTFPAGPVDNLENTMSFGQCKDSWNDSSSAQKTANSSFESPMNENNDYPPVPGNCVTGGRTGYSVKIVTPSILMDQSKMLNPIPQSFFTF